MQRQGRSGNHGNRSGNAGNGSGMAGDPFAGFGFGGGRSMMENFFGDRNPFDDPFFNRPFGSFNDGFFSNGGMFGGGFLEQRPFNPPPPQGSRRGPVIQEIEEDTHHDHSGSHEEPIVEHPDDDGRPAADYNRSSRPQSRSIARHGEQAQNNGVHSYSFQSSSVTYGGPNGTYYSTSTARRAGPNGVVHEEHFEKDSRKGEEVQRVSKGIIDKGHSVTRKRNAEGREDTVETLHNLEEDEVSEFDKRWESEAEKGLPGWSRSRVRTLDGSSRGNGHRAALPSSSSSRGNSVARRA